MFKNKLKYTLIFLLSAVFLSVAQGYNLVEYCCDGCAGKGMDVLLNNACNDLHQSDACCAQHAQHTSDEEPCSKDGCKSIFLKVDDSLITESENEIADLIQEQVVPMFHICCVVPCVLSSHHTDISTENQSPPDDIPSFDSGRELLTAVCILRI